MKTVFVIKFVDEDNTIYYFDGVSYSKRLSLAEKYESYSAAEEEIKEQINNNKVNWGGYWFMQIEKYYRA